MLAKQVKPIASSAELPLHTGTPVLIGMPDKSAETPIVPKVRKGVSMKGVPGVTGPGPKVPPLRGVNRLLMPEMSP